MIGGSIVTRSCLACTLVLCLSACLTIHLVSPSVCRPNCTLFSISFGLPNYPSCFTISLQAQLHVVLILFILPDHPSGFNIGLRAQLHVALLSFSLPDYPSAFTIGLQARLHP